MSMIRKPVVLVGTPCYGGLLNYQYVVSLIGTREFLRQHNIELDFRFLGNESLITRGRNNIVASFMANPIYTHLFFIDGDIEWRPEDVLKLVNANKGIVGGAYPKKNYFWRKLLDKQTREALGINLDTISEQELKYKLLDYVMNLSEDQSIINNLIKVRHIGTGFMLIQRNVIESMIRQYPATKYYDDIGMLTKEEDQYAYALFDCIIEQGHYLSEDYTFCKRWTDMGGAVYLDVTIGLSHCGTHKFEGSFFSRYGLQRLLQPAQQQPSQATPEPIKPQLFQQPATLKSVPPAAAQPVVQPVVQQGGIPKTRKFVNTDIPLSQYLYKTNGYAEKKHWPQDPADIVTEANVKDKIQEFLTGLPEYPRDTFSGRGIVISGGGKKYINSTYIIVSLLRKVHKCNLPIEWWYIGEEEMSQDVKLRLEAEFTDVTCRDLSQAELVNGHKLLNYNVRPCYETKPLAILASRFEEVLLIDADNMPFKDPSCLFEIETYKKTGNYFWGDFWRGTYDTSIYTILGLDHKQYENINDTESGQGVINKAQCWKEINLAWWMNNHSYFFYKYCWGDKDEYRLAWTCCNSQFSQNPHLPQSIGKIDHASGLFRSNNMVHFDDKRDPVLFHMTLCKGNADFDIWDTLSRNVEFWAMQGNYLATDLNYGNNMFIPIPYPIQNVLNIVKEMWSKPYLPD